MSEPPRTPDGRYIVVDGVLWRATRPDLAEAERDRLVHALMAVSYTHMTLPTSSSV